VKEKILDTAKRLFQQHGVKTITIDDVAHHLSISKKTIYEHFSHKEEIADQVITKILEESIQTIEAIHLNESNSLQKVIAVFNWIFKALTDTNPIFLEDIKKYFFKSYIRFQNQVDSKFIRTFADIIEEGKDNDLFRRDLNSLIMAKYCIELIRNSIRDEQLSKDSRSISTIFHFFILGLISNKGKLIYDKAIAV
jgi:TetR/AcrR family transcriptional regulator, cholesterol catabolism regulator